MTTNAELAADVAALEQARLALAAGATFEEAVAIRVRVREALLAGRDC
jgi:hypothetical protein